MQSTSDITVKMFLQRVVILFPALILLVSAGCSFKDQMESTQSSFKDLDQAKFAAKMALAHKGLDIETLKKRQASIDNETLKRREEKQTEETYIPTYITAEGPQKEQIKTKKNIDEFEGDIWELAGRSNSKSPRQDLGEIKTEL